MPSSTAAIARATATVNTRITHDPARVAIVTDATQLVDVVRAAIRDGFRVAVRSTGHGMWPVANDTVIVDVGGIDAISIDAERGTATVGPGVCWSNLLEEAGKQGFGALAGSSPTVGTVGFHLGGGIGPVSRAFGFSADYVRAFQMVTSDGERLSVNADEHPDLFWAMRGGGAIGIVTSMTFDLVPGANLRGGGLYFPADTASTVLHRWREWVEDLPTSVSTSVGIIDIPSLPYIPEPIRGRRVLHLRYSEVGGNQDSPPAVLRFGSAIFGGIRPMQYQSLAEIHAEPTNAKPTMQDSALLGDLTAEAIDRFVESSVDDSLSLTVRELRLLGGRLSHPQRGENAVAGRDAAFLHFGLGDAPPERADAVAQGLDAYMNAMQPWSTGTTLASFAGEGRGRERIDAAWSAVDLARLRAVRSTYDPTGRFDPNIRWTRQAPEDARDAS